MSLAAIYEISSATVRSPTVAMQSTHDVREPEVNCGRAGSVVLNNDNPVIFRQSVDTVPRNITRQFFGSRDTK